jgi:hypothetical protein
LTSLLSLSLFTVIKPPALAPTPTFLLSLSIFRTLRPPPPNSIATVPLEQTHKTNSATMFLFFPSWLLLLLSDACLLHRNLECKKERIWGFSCTVHEQAEHAAARFTWLQGHWHVRESERARLMQVHHSISCSSAPRSSSRLTSRSMRRVWLNWTASAAHRGTTWVHYYCLWPLWITQWFLNLPNGFLESFPPGQDISR